MPKYYVSCKDVQMYMIISRDNAEQAARDSLKRFKELHPDDDLLRGVVDVSEIGMGRTDGGIFSISGLLKDVT